MKTFREIAILEKTKLMGKLKPYDKILHDAFIEFLKDYFKVNKDIIVSFRKPNSKLYFGFIDLVALRAGKYKIVVENSPYGILGKIGHEFTHIAQSVRGDFDYSDDEKHIIWKGKEYMTVKEYSSITDIDTHKKVPWEKEAYDMQEKLPKLFKKSKYLKDILGTNATLDYGVENDLWF